MLHYPRLYERDGVWIEPIVRDSKTLNALQPQVAMEKEVNLTLFID